MLTQMLGTATMLELLLEAQLHDATWAERRGIVARVVGDLEQDLRATIGRITSGSPMSNRHHKRLVDRAAQGNLTGEAETVRLSYAAVETADYRVGIQAFLERRPANFTGN
jgi:2-(1,2-epoxy-1,2-dihydrophenyl)acetyl-CoA isomerase